MCLSVYELTYTYYELISVSVKRAYHRVSLKVHPDRVEEEEKEESTKKFQALGKVYSVLSDPEKRKIYDETGKKEIFHCIDHDYIHLP